MLTSIFLTGTMLDMRTFLCLYLNTGGGHRSAAMVFEEIMKESHPDTTVILEGGLKQTNRISKFLIEKMYQIACNYFPFAWAFFYWFAGHYTVQWIITALLRPLMTRYVIKLIQKYNPTDILSFHFLLTPHIVTAIKNVNPNIRFSVVITDPFTGTSAWFFERKAQCVVSSEQFKNFATDSCKIPDNQISVLPYLIHKEYHVAPTREKIYSLKYEHEIPLDNKVLLITGGGGGLPSISLIIKQLVMLNPNYTILAVCGYDSTSKKYLHRLANKHPNLDIRIMGFISNMHEMIQLCDCAIIKAGPATVFEALCSKKPVIISTYLRNQELGNMRYVIDNKVGWYIENPKKIAHFAHELLNNSLELQKVKNSLESLHIDTNTKKIADYFFYK